MNKRLARIFFKSSGSLLAFMPTRRWLRRLYESMHIDALRLYKSIHITIRVSTYLM